MTRPRTSPAPLLLPVALLGLLAAGLVLRSELMTVHEPTPAGSSTEVVMAARGKKDPSVLAAQARGLADTCRLAVNAHAAASGWREVRPAVYAFRLTPGLDEFDLRELRGCLQDLREDKLLVDVQQLRTTAPG